MTSPKIWKIFQDIADSWNNNNTEQMAAALSLYAILSLPSLIILIVTLSGFFYNNSDLQANISAFLPSIFNEKTSQSVSTVMNMVMQSQQKTSASITSILIFIWTTIALFEHVVSSLHSLWKIKKKDENTLKKLIWDKIFAFVFILFIDGVLFFSFFVQSITSFFIKIFNNGSDFINIFLTMLNLFMGLMLPFLLFFLIFTFLSDHIFSIKDAAIGASFTTLLFVLGNYLLGIYFEKFVDYSAFGGANIVIMTLVWIYYVSQIFFLGAEVTYYCAKSNI